MLGVTHYKKVVQFNCNYCTSVFYNEEQIQQHTSDKHFTYSCKVIHCNFLGENEMNLLQHIISSHFPDIFVYKNCLECGVGYIKETSLYQHMRDKHGIYIEDENEELSETIEIHCKLCPNYKCINKNTFGNHMTKYHPLIFMKCPYSDCSYNTNKFWELGPHMRDHLTRETVYNQCPGCSVGFLKSSSMAQHYRDKQNLGDDQHSYDLEDFNPGVFSECYCTLCNFKYDEDDSGDDDEDDSEDDDEDDSDDDDEDDNENFYLHLKDTHKIVFPRWN